VEVLPQQQATPSLTFEEKVFFTLARITEKAAALVGAQVLLVCRCARKSDGVKVFALRWLLVSCQRAGFLRW
jgi:hypothetical protein